MRVSNRPILLVEDDEVDAMTVRRALKQIRVPNALRQAEHGEAAIAYLSDDSQARPCLVLLDLNMPIMSGLEFLRVVKAHPDWRRIPVVVLTTSQEPQDKLESFDRSVAGYLIKPVDFGEFVETMRTIDGYWTRSEEAPA